MEDLPIYENPVMLADGSHRGMNAGGTPGRGSGAPGLLAAAPTTWTGLQPGRTRGVDSSHWNGNVAPHVGVQVYGIEWWAHKATEGAGYVDPTFRKAQADMRAARVRYRVWYHFPRNNVNIKAQVDHFLAVIGPLWVGEAAKLDDEAATGLGCLTIKQAAEWHERVEQATGRPTVQYTGGYVRNPADPFYHWDAEVLREGTFGHRPNIFASYNSETVSRSHARGKPWDVWQLSSSGNLPGIQTGGITVIDLDRLDNRAEYDRACGYDDVPVPDPPPPPQEDESVKVIIAIKGYSNSWTETGLHLSPEVAQELTANQGYKVVTCEPHAQMIRSLLHLSGLTEADLAPTG